MQLNLIFGVLLILTACESKLIPHVEETPSVRFETHIKPITSTVCAQCHIQKGRDFSKYEDAYNFRFQIHERVVVNKTMPWATPMSDQDRALFRDWVNQGGKK